MRILVTGGAGYIGSHTCKKLAAAGHEPIVFDNLSTGHRGFARFGPLVQGDINDVGALHAALARHLPDAIIHFAASAYVGESIARPLAYYRNNVGGTRNVLEAAVEAGVTKFVFSSSCATYGIPDVVPIDEASRQRPINPYGDTKLFGETMMRGVSAVHQIDCVALRYFNAAGADLEGYLGEAHDPETHVIPLILQAAADPAKRFSILGVDYDTPDGSCVRDFLHVEDLADAHCRALERLSGTAGFDAINLGTGYGLSVRELIAAAERITGRHIAVDIKPRRPGDPPVLVADPAKALATLGWQARHSDIDTIMRSAWAWLRAADNPARHTA